MATYNDTYKSWLKDNITTPTGENILDLERQFLVEYVQPTSTKHNLDLYSQLFYDLGYTSGTLSDKWYSYLTDEGYTGQLRNKQIDFWISGSFIPAQSLLIFAAKSLSATHLVSSKGTDGTRLPQGGNCVTFNGTTQSITATHLVGTETVVSSNGTATPTVSAGSISFTAGNCQNLILSDGTIYRLDEKFGSVAFDSSGNGNNGTYINAPTHTQDSTLPAPTNQNEYGFTVSDGVTYYTNNDDTGLIPVDTLIPRDESDITKCTAYLAGGAQADLQYSGKVKMNAKLEKSNCVELDGIDDDVVLNIEPVELFSTGVFDLKYSFKRLASIARAERILWIVSDTGFFRLQANDGTTSSVTFWCRKDAGEDIIPQTNVTVPIGVDSDIRLLGDGTNCKVYVNDVLTTTVAMTTANFYTPASYSYVGLTSGTGSGTNSKVNRWELQTASISQVLNFGEGSGAIAYDSSGQGNHATLMGGVAWTTQDLFHYNITKGFNKYMVWDGENDYVSIPIVTGGVTNATIEIRNVIATGDTGILLTSGTSTANFLGVYDSGSSNFIVNIGSGTPTITVDGVAFSGTRGALHTLLSDGLPHTVRWANVDLTDWTETIRAGWFGGSAPFKFEGIMSDITFDLTSDGIVEHRYNGYGTTNADWTDQVGSANGTVVGSPMPIRIPKLISANTDVFGNALRNIPIIGHNDAETTINFRDIGVDGDVPPTMNILANATPFTAFSFDADTGWDTYDYAFYRQQSTVKNNRFILYSEALTGADLTKANNYTGN